MPLRSAVNPDSIESVSIAILVERLGRVADARMRDICAALAVAVACSAWLSTVRAPVSLGEAIHGAVPGSEFVVLTGPGHVSKVEAPDDVTRVLRRFLRSAEPPPT